MSFLAGIAVAPIAVASGRDAAAGRLDAAVREVRT
jgi:hypothetical protein